MNKFLSAFRTLSNPWRRTAWRRALGSGAAAWLLVLSLWASPATACPFCDALSSSFSEQLGGAPSAVLAVCVSANLEGGPDYLPQHTFRIQHVLKASEEVAEYRLAVDTEVKVHSLRPHQAGDVVLLLGFVEAGILDWAPSDRLPEVVQKYVLNLPGPAATAKQRMGFFLDHLFASEQIIADDAYNEFARASLAELDAVKPLLDRSEIMRRIELEETPINRRRLYWTLMSLCGKPDDAQWIQQKLLKRRRGSEQTIGLDAAISCYLVLGGDEALKFVKQEFLLNEKTDYPDTYAAVLALRVHAQELQVFSRQQLVTAMSGLLRSSDLADLIIPDLARMEDWRHVERMVELYAQADDKNPFVRVPVVNYLRVCPLPSAVEALQRCREIDPSAVKRSITIFPNLQPVQSTGTEETTGAAEVEPVSQNQQQATER